ncbi:pyridine nucleotide transhydrogenase subunit alpha [mine drainage metagenome]|uniref:proton-translocating NAD(P)(+) transhydrogenase n=1 Tax=mine drainage metagenome TaxID=410659 RepID=T0ZX07_9ZZZZ
MSAHLVNEIAIFVLAVFLGFEVIAKVPTILHTPLMSGSNAIHGVILVGAMVIMAGAHGALQESLGFVAVTMATVNVVGGFVVTDRMLEMFRSRTPRGPQPRGPRTP